MPYYLLGLKLVNNSIDRHKNTNICITRQPDTIFLTTILRNKVFVNKKLVRSITLQTPIYIPFKSLLKPKMFLQIIDWKNVSFANAIPYKKKLPKYRAVFSLKISNDKSLCFETNLL